MITAIVNARMNSTRLPGKVMREVYQGRTMLDLFLERVKMAELVDQIVVAVPKDSINDPILEEAKRLGVETFESDRDTVDVLGRTYDAAQAYHANAVLRVTPDCPLIDPTVISRVTWNFMMNRNGIGYSSNCWYSGFPRGQEVEVFSMAVLDDLETNPDVKLTEYDREHVTPYIRRYPRRYGHFDVQPVAGAQPNGVTFHESFKARLTVDTEEDLEVVKRIYEGLYPQIADLKGHRPPNMNVNTFLLTDIKEFLDENPDILEINKDIKQVV